jgi:chemotaxis protein methyltransferase WspC
MRLFPNGPHDKSQPTPDALLAQARRQADVGQLDPALELCRAVQDRFGPSADLYSLTGIIHQARQDRPAASAAFRKALYLEPNHREALMHLMLLCQQHGDLAQAALLRKRLERLPAATGGGE